MPILYYKQVILTCKKSKIKYKYKKIIRKKSLKIYNLYYLFLKNYSIIWEKVV